MFVRPSFAPFVVLWTCTLAMTCHNGGKEDEGQLWGPSCDAPNFAEVCYRDKNNWGCLPAKYISYIDASKEACNEHGGCWCLTSDCNTKEWHDTFVASYEPPPMCWSGSFGAIEEPSCEETEVYKANKYEDTECDHRSWSNRCVENNMHVGEGDGCGDQDSQGPCESYRPEGREPREVDESFDKTDRHCRWLSSKTEPEKKSSCETDDLCEFESEHGNCLMSAKQKNAMNAWNSGRGRECRDRMKIGCYYNNIHASEQWYCTEQKEQSTCLAVADKCEHDSTAGDCSGEAIPEAPCNERTNEYYCTSVKDGQNSGCSWEGDSPHSGTCSGIAVPTAACSERRSQDHCTNHRSHLLDTNCSWARRCCDWGSNSTDLAGMCSNRGAGSLDGLCEYFSGFGPPTKFFVDAGLNYWQKADKFNGQCGMAVSFQNGKGSAFAAGSDAADLIARACRHPYWKMFVETGWIGHSDASIDEYCQNWLPGDGAVKAIKKHSPSFIIARAEEGQFGALFPEYQGMKYLVTTNPEYGKCLLFAEKGVFGSALCTCPTAECNKAAMSLMMNRRSGAVRFLQFIDSSLIDSVDAVNDVVPNLLDSSGRMNRAEVSKVTEGNVDKLIEIIGESTKMNKTDLLCAVQDFQRLLDTEAKYKTRLSADVKALAIAPSKVAAANAAAGGQLYQVDGTPNTYLLKALDSSKLTAVAKAVGLTLAAFTKASEEAASPKQVHVALTLPGKVSDYDTAEAKGALAEGMVETLKKQSGLALNQSDIEVRVSAGRRLAPERRLAGVKVLYIINAPADTQESPVGTDSLLAGVEAMKTNPAVMAERLNTKLQALTTFTGPTITASVLSVEDPTLIAVPAPDSTTPAATPTTPADTPAATPTTPADTPTSEEMLADETICIHLSRTPFVGAVVLAVHHIL